jgi:hypothetical protein
LSSSIPLPVLQVLIQLIFVSVRQDGSFSSGASTCPQGVPQWVRYVLAAAGAASAGHKDVDQAEIDQDGRPQRR